MYFFWTNINYRRSIFRFKHESIRKCNGSMELDHEGESNVDREIDVTDRTQSFYFNQSVNKSDLFLEYIDIMSMCVSLFWALCKVRIPSSKSQKAFPFDWTHSPIMSWPMHSLTDYARQGLASFSFSFWNNWRCLYLPKKLLQLLTPHKRACSCLQQLMRAPSNHGIGFVIFGRKKSVPMR